MAKRKRRIRRHRGRSFQRRGGMVERLGMGAVGVVGGYGLSNVLAPLLEKMVGGFAPLLSPAGAVAVSEMFLKGMPTLQTGVTNGALLSLVKQMAIYFKVDQLTKFLAGDGDLPVVTQEEFARIVDQASNRKEMAGIYNPTVSGLANPTVAGGFYAAGSENVVLAPGQRMGTGYWGD